MSFGFEDGEHIAWSVEVRREKTGEFSPVADAFKFTRWSISPPPSAIGRLRSNVRGEDVRLYRLRTPPARRARCCWICSESNALAERPNVQFDHRELRDRRREAGQARRGDAAVRLATHRQRLSAGLPLRPRRVVTTMPLSEFMERARIVPGEGGGRIARLLAAIRVGVPSPWNAAPN